MKIKTSLQCALVLAVILGKIDFLGASGPASSVFMEMEVEDLTDNTDCAICLVPTTADNVCVCLGVSKGHREKKHRDRECWSFFLECFQRSRGLGVQNLLVGDEVAVDEANANKGHFFHQTCLNQWVQKGGNCPICRREFAVNERMRLLQDIAF